jgi:hypothetical protein
MFAAFLATLLFSLSVVAASRTTRALGGTTANFYRLCLATTFLALWAHGVGQGLGGGAFGWFFVSGVIGFGLVRALARAAPNPRHDLGGGGLVNLLQPGLGTDFASSRQRSRSRGRPNFTATDRGRGRRICRP